MGGYIIGRCFTNLDKFKTEVWPTKFSCKPEKGDLVESESEVLLKVVSVAHTAYKYGEHEPILKIELHNL